MPLLTSSDAKTTKGQPLGYLTGILYLAPHKIAGRNVCPNATAGCKLGCLYSSGRGKFSNVKKARIAKTKKFFADPKAFVDELSKDILALLRKAARRGLIPCVRLNGTSDLPWEKLKGTNGKTLMQEYPSLIFYDYTKSPQRMVTFINDEMPSNYHLTFSRSEKAGMGTLYAGILRSGGNVAAVVNIKRGKPLPPFGGSTQIVDGDEHDLRFLDPKGCIVGLRAKGDAIKDTSGFVLRIAWITNVLAELDRVVA